MDPPFGFGGGSLGFGATGGGVGAVVFGFSSVVAGFLSSLVGSVFPGTLSLSSVALSSFLSSGLLPVGLICLVFSFGSVPARKSSLIGFSVFSSA